MTVAQQQERLVRMSEAPKLLRLSAATLRKRMKEFGITSMPCGLDQRERLIDVNAVKKLLEERDRLHKGQ